MDTIKYETESVNDENNLEETKVEKESTLEKISFIVLLVSIFLTPLIFLPSTVSSFETVKTITIVLGVLVSGILYFISTLKTKEISLPKHPIVWSGISIIICLIIATLSSTNVDKSFFGQGFEIGTAGFILILFLGSLLTYFLTEKNKERAMYIYTAVIVSFVIVALFHLVRLIGGAGVLNFGLFQSLTSSIIGKWKDFGILAGFVAFLSYAGINFLTLNRLSKVLFSILIVISGLILLVVNYSSVWMMISLTIIGFIIYQYSIKTTDKEGKVARFVKRVPWISVLILIVSLTLAFNGNIIHEKIVSKTNLFPVDIIFPWQLTIDVASETIKESPLFGAGPNRFGVQYLKYKPLEVNSTVFYDTEFSHGFGLIPSFFVTQGLVGGILWIIFIIVLCHTGFREIRKKTDSLSKFFTVSTFFSTVFLWLMFLVYVPSHFILFLSFVSLGLFLSSISPTKYVLTHKKIILPITILLIVILAVGLLIYFKKTLALAYFQSGISTLRTTPVEELDKVERKFKKALFLDESDIYYQALSEMTIVKINLLAQQANNSQISQEIIDQVTGLVDEGVKYTRQAVSEDPTNYYNYIAESRISETALGLGITNAYENIKSAYANALRLNPFSPTLYLNLARIEASQQNFAEAQRHIGSAIQLKQNYIDAIFFLSQIQVSQGKIKDAITSVQVASQINPNNPLVFFQLGLLHYNDKNFEKAIEALTQAVALDENYANAQYFLGLSYARTGDIFTAIPYFEKLAETNPDNQEVQLILQNLRAGRSPFAQAQPPIDNTPEQRKTLPIKENTTR